VVPLAVPNTVSMPPLRIFAPLATPPDTT